MIQRFRRIWRFLTPPWLQSEDGDGAKILFSLGLVKDAFVERARAGLEARFPSRAGTAANALTAGDRGILRGRAEPASSFVQRLLAWRSPRTHRVRGNAYEAIQQIWHYWGGIYAATVDSHGLRHVIQANGTDSRDTLDRWVNTITGVCKWDNTSYSTDWARFWIVLQPQVSLGVGTQPELGDPTLWGGSLGVDGYTLGQTGATPDDVLAMRKLFSELNWHPGHTRPEWLILSLDAVAQPVPAPNGQWRYWSKDFAGIRIAARVTPGLGFIPGNFTFQNGPGTMSIDMPDGLAGGELLFLQEARATPYDAAPAGWTIVATSPGPFQTQRLYARLATAGEPASFNYAVTGIDDHAFKVVGVTAPPEGWNTNVLANFADIFTSTHAAPSIANPENQNEQHRLNFLINDFFDVPQTSSTTGYDEIYDSTGEINLSLTTSTTKVTASTTTFAAGDATLISLRLVYNVAWRFWSINPEHNNTYSGIRSRPWPMGATIVDGGDTFGGNRANAAAFGAAMLPGGSPYAGTSGQFPTRVLLPDDGSIPR